MINITNCYECAFYALNAISIEHDIFCPKNKEVKISKNNIPANCPFKDKNGNWVEHE